MTRRSCVASTSSPTRNTSSNERTPARVSPNEELSRLRAIEVSLDQCWDLLRQRRARRSTGQDPDDAQVRPEGVVEGYQQ